MVMTQQGRIRRSSVEGPTVSVDSTCCYADAIASPYSSSIDQDTLSLLLAASAQNGFGPGAAIAGLPDKAQMPSLGPTSTACASVGYDPSMIESEEPGPLPCLPRTRALGSGGPYGSAALMMQQHQQQQPASYNGARQGRPRRHSVTIGMLNEHQQQQQAAAYAAALAAAQQSGFAGGSMPGQHGAGGAAALGIFSQLPQVQQQPHMAGAPSPAKQHLQALNNVQAMATAAQLGMGTNPLLANLALQQPDQFASQLAPSNGSSVVVPPGAADLTDLEAQFNPTGPRLPNAGGCRRHSWAPTGLNGLTAYAQALLLQQQQQRQLAAAAAAMGDARGLLGLNGMHALGQQKGLGGVARQPAAGYGNGNSYLNGPAPNGSGPPSGGFAGLSTAAAAAAMAHLSSLQSAGALAGFDAATEQQLQRLLQLQQQAGLAAGQPALDPYMEAVLEAGQGLGTSTAAVLPGAAPLGALPGVASGLLPGAVGATTHLAQLGLDSDSLSPAAAAAAASMYAPLKVNGVTLDSQLLVAPFADNWDVMCVQGQGGLTPQQLAATAALNGQLTGTGYGVMSPRASPAAQSAAALHAKHQKGLPARSGSCGSNSSTGSANGASHHPSTTAAVPSAHVGTYSNGKNSAVANTSSAAGAAAALAAASAVAAAPPMANVCSDAPWDLKMAAEEDAKVLAAQEGRVQRLMSALERSQTLAKVRAAQAASMAAAPVAASDAAADSNSRDAAQPVLFGYKLADTGTDAWGGSSSSAAIENAPGSGCISQEPSNKLFVGNIGWWVTEDDLLHWFSRFGTVVHVKIMYNSRKMHKPKDKWRSREYGFIDYATPEEAAKAIVWMDGVELPDLMKDTCGIIVQYAKPTGTPCIGNGSGSSNGINGHSLESHMGTPSDCMNGFTPLKS